MKELNEKEKDLLVEVLNTNDGCGYFHPRYEKEIRKLVELGIIEADCAGNIEWCVSITEKGIEIAKNVFGQ